MVNPNKVEGLIRRLQDHVEKLGILAMLSEKEFLGDFTKLNSAKYLLQVSIESCLAISNHLIASEKYRAPTDYADVFHVLSEKQVIPDAFSQKLQKMIGFRNRIVRVYWDVDDSAVYHLLHTSLQDFSDFAQHIVKFINRNP